MPKKTGELSSRGKLLLLFCTASPWGSEWVKSTDAEIVLVHLWQEGVIWTSQTDFSTQIKWWFSNCAKAFRSNVSVMRFWLWFFCIWQWMKSGSVMPSHPTNWDLSWPDVTTDDCWPLIQPIIFSLSYCHPGPHVPTQKGKIRSPPVYHPNVPRHCHLAFGHVKTILKKTHALEGSASWGSEYILHILLIPTDYTLQRIYIDITIQ